MADLKEVHVLEEVRPEKAEQIHLVLAVLEARTHQADRKELDLVPFQVALVGPYFLPHQEPGEAGPRLDYWKDY